jgi:hypothetical protein
VRVPGSELLAAYYGLRMYSARKNDGLHIGKLEASIDDVN